MSTPTVNLDFSQFGSKVKSSKINGGLFINGEFVPSVTGRTFKVVNPSTGKEVGEVSECDAKDIDKAVEVARKAYNTVWGLNTDGAARGKMLNQFADALEEHREELAAIESLDNGKPYSQAYAFDLGGVIGCIRYYAGWADKITGKTIEVNETKLAYTRHEPIGVVGQIIPWNFPLLMLAWKLGPALATGNTVILKTAEQTPLGAQKVAELAQKIFPPGVLNIVSGFGNNAGAAISAHMDIDKVAFTGSTLVGRQILKAAAESNLKRTTLELGGKSPNIIFEDADMEQAVSWAAFGLFYNHGQCCCAGSRVFVQASIYDKFMEAFTAKVKSINVGNPFEEKTFQGPQVSQLQFDRVMGYIKEGKESGAKTLMGGERKGTEGYFIEPTIFTDADPNSKIVREEIFGPVVVVIKFEDEKDLIKQANDTVYGLAAAVFSKNIDRALQTAHKLNAGTVWINCYNLINWNVPFGGYKQSGIGRELGEYALDNYTNVKAVHVNFGMPNLI